MKLSSNSFVTSLVGGATIASNQNYQLPSVINADSYLKTDASGVLSWISPPSGFIIVSQTNGDFVGSTEVAINNAINSISSGTILIKAGTYLISNPIILKSKINLIGEGSQATILTGQSGLTYVFDTFQAGTGAGLDGNTISNMQLNGVCTLSAIRIQGGLNAGSLLENLNVSTTCVTSVEYIDDGSQINQYNQASHCNFIGWSTNGVSISNKTFNSQFSSCTFVFANGSPIALEILCAK